MAPKEKDQAQTATSVDYEVTTIVVLAHLRDQAESAAQAAEPNGGAGTFNPGVMLRRPGDQTNVPAAYWCRWAMKPGQRAAFASAMGGPMNVLAPGATVDTGRDRWMFDNATEGWSNDEVLAALNLARPWYDPDGP